MPRQIPTLFSGPMVLALLREIEEPGTGKTTTRRISKKQDWPEEIVKRFPNQKAGVPYAVGDLLWVREAWRTLQKRDNIAPRHMADDISKITYEADPERRNPLWAFGRLRPGIHMPKWASRITLEVVGVKIERLQDVSPEDAIAEGLLRVGDHWQGTPEATPKRLPTEAFRDIWTSIHGRGAWEDNPWLVCLSFRPHLRNILDWPKQEAA